MKKKFKTFLCVTVLAALLLPLCAWHGAKTSKAFEVPDSFDESKSYEITFWAKNDTNVNQTRIYQQAIQDFQQIYPNISVNMRLYTDYGRIYNDVITNIATQTTPNVCITYPDHIATYLSGENVVVPLDDLMRDKKFGFSGSEVKFDAPSYDEVVPEFLNEGKINGIQYAVPYMRSTEALYINKTFVEKLGYAVPDVVTWDFIWEVSEAATKKDASGNFVINGQKVMIPFIYKSTDNMMIQLLKQKDAGYSSENGEVLLFNDTTKEILQTVASHVKTGAFSTFKISSYPANFLNAGQCIFAVDSTAGATWMGTYAPLLDIAADQLVEFETVVRPIPQENPEDPVMISQGPSICIFNKDDTGEVLASWLFVQYLLSNKVQIAYAETEGYVPVTKKAQESEEYQSYLDSAVTHEMLSAGNVSDDDRNKHYYVKIEASKLLLAHTEDTFVTPVFNGSASLRDAAGQLIEETAKGTRRKKTVDDAFIEKLYSDVTSLYRLDQIVPVGETKDMKKDLGPLPKPAKILLTCIAVVWVGLAIWNGAIWLKKKKMANS